MRLWLVLGTGLVITLLWEWILPLKLLVVLVHEIWHGVAALLSGAVLDQIDVNLAESGETLVSGLHTTSGFVFSVSAGYIGTAMVGAMLLARGLRGEWERTALAIFAGLLLYMSYLFANPASVAFYAGIGWSLGLLVLAMLGALPARLALLVLGTVFVWYCFFDLFDFTRDIERTDAGILARYILANDWPGFADSDPISLASGVSIIWCFLMFGMLAIFLGPVLREMTASTPVPPAPPAEDELAGFADGMAYPGEPTPEVQEWLLANGFGLDGRPLPPELLEPAPGAGAPAGAPGDFVIDSGAAKT